MSYDASGLDIEGLKRTVKIGTQITFGYKSTLVHGKVIGIYDQFFLVEANFTNAFGTAKRKFNFTWKDLAIWEGELQNRIRYQSVRKPIMEPVFIHNDAKQAALRTEDYLEIKAAAAPAERSYGSSSAGRPALARPKKTRRKPERDPKVVEAMAYQKKCEAEARARGEKRDKFTRIYHKCPALVIEHMKKGEVLLTVDVDEDGFTVIQSFCVAASDYTPWPMPKGREETRFLFCYYPSHYLAENGVGGESVCEAGSSEEWRARYQGPGTWISIYSEGSDLQDIWVRYDGSDFLNTGRYNMEEFEGSVLYALTSTYCYLSKDRGNVYGPLEAELMEKILKEHPECHLYRE